MNYAMMILNSVVSLQFNILGRDFVIPVYIFGNFDERLTCSCVLGFIQAGLSVLTVNSFLFTALRRKFFYTTDLWLQYRKR